MAQHPHGVRRADLGQADRRSGHSRRLGLSEPIWQAKPETASRVRGRIERVLNSAKAEGYRSGENPAAWRGHLDATLPKPRSSQGPSCRPALRRHARVHGRTSPPPGAGSARARTDGSDSDAHERSAEAEWAEFDLDAGLWKIPAARMKARKEHRVARPLVRSPSSRRSRRLGPRNPCSPVRGPASCFQTWRC